MRALKYNVLSVTSSFDEISVGSMTPIEMSTAVPSVSVKLPNRVGKYPHRQNDRKWTSMRGEVNSALYRILKRSGKGWPHWAVNHFQRLKNAVGALTKELDLPWSKDLENHVRKATRLYFFPDSPLCREDFIK